ncbi:hypothetical protein MASR1M101_34350 [Gemmatimonas sp.]
MPKGVRRLPGFDETVLALYARGLTTRELQGYLEERYQVPVSPDLISTVTSEVMEEVTAWQRRPLDPVYIAVVFDALRVKIRGEGVVQNKAVYLALGVLPDGTKEVLGLWIAQTEGAAFWHRVFSELQSRGVQDILVAMIDGLAGLPEALHTVFPQTTIHQCVVHLVRQSLQFVGWKERKLVAADLRQIYTAPSEAAAQAALAHVRATWGGRFRRLRRSGSAPGTVSPRVSSIRWTRAACSTRRMRSRASIAISANRSAPAPLPQ